MAGPAVKPVGTTGVRVGQAQAQTVSTLLDCAAVEVSAAGAEGPNCGGGQPQKETRGIDIVVAQVTAISGGNVGALRIVAFACGRAEIADCHPGHTRGARPNGDDESTQEMHVERIRGIQERYR